MDRQTRCISSSSGGGKIKEVEVKFKPRMNMMRLKIEKDSVYPEEQKTPEPQEEPKTPEVEEQPSTPEISEEAKRDASVTQQMVFEKIHEELVYDALEQNLLNLIDIEAEGGNDTKEMRIELGKKMTFRFQVHTSHPHELRKLVKGLVDHFEGNLSYKLKIQ